LVDIVRSVTGWRTSLFELLKGAERAWTMARAFNLREGLSASDDTLPDRMFEGLEKGALQGHAIDRKEFDAAVTAYYGMMGWDENGTPRKEKLQELAVEWVWDHVKQVK
jgi:aldehyde:ferredoxin oxidoreductase